MSDPIDRQTPEQNSNEVVSETLEDLAFSKAIEEGLKSETVSRDEVFKILERQKVQHEIFEYAQVVAGTSDDLDEDLQRAALESWSDLP